MNEKYILFVNESIYIYKGSIGDYKEVISKYKIANKIISGSGPVFTFNNEDDLLHTLGSYDPDWCLDFSDEQVQLIKKQMEIDSEFIISINLEEGFLVKKFNLL